MEVEVRKMSMFVRFCQKQKKRVRSKIQNKTSTCTAVQPILKMIKNLIQSAVSLPKLKMNFKSVETRCKTQYMPLQHPIFFFGRICQKFFLKSKSSITQKADLFNKGVCNKVACYNKFNQPRSMALRWVLVSQTNKLRSTLLKKRSKKKNKRVRCKVNKISLSKERIALRTTR